MSSIETIGHKLQSLEERLQAENESHDRLLADKLMETTPIRQNRKMFLPVISTTPAPETETDKKLKKIMKQTGILTINGRQYCTDIQDLEHLGDLGNGTSGNVVKMRHIPSGTIIAVKQMRRTGNSEENKRILMDLDVVLKSHDCPYIVQCLGCFVRDPDVWICMELMSMCFDKLLKLSKKPVPEDILGKVTVATVKALSYLKEKHGVIHRDVKPSNILIDERGNIKLCDFGISGRLVDSKANTRSAGCAAYMAPERIDPKKPKYDIRADVWSLGITQVELATARSPYEGCNTDFEVLTKVLESDPPSLPYGEGFNFSPEFRDFVSKCLTKNHQYRPKYPELLEQPFIKIYEVANVDVPKWFQNVVESAGIKTHRTIMPKTSQDSIQKSNNSKHSNFVGTTMPSTSTNSKPYTQTQTQIPSYQHNHHNRHRRDEFYQQLQYPSLQLNQSTQLPQPLNADISNIYSNNNYHAGIDGGGGGNSNSHSNGIYNNKPNNASSPHSPPSVGSTAYYANKGTAATFAYRPNNVLPTSPLAQRKSHKPAASHDYLMLESPRDTPPSPPPNNSTLFSSIGKGIVRQLTSTKPIQEKDPVKRNNHFNWFWEKSQSTVHSSLYDDGTDSRGHLKMNSPNGGRKRVPRIDEKILAAGTGEPLSDIMVQMDYHKKLQLQQQQQQQQQRHQPTLIPNDKHDVGNSPQQRVHGSHSPIVLQRFYHQQNQLREREMERMQLYDQTIHNSRSSRSPDKQTIPYLSNMNHATKAPNATTAATTTTSNSNANFHYNHNHTQIPIATGGASRHGNGGVGLGIASVSTHSTSSQSSSTMSSSSQIPTMPATTKEEIYNNDANSKLPTNTAFGVGIVGGQLQYQPLPQQYLRSNTPRSSRSPPASPDQDPDLVVRTVNAASSMASKLNKFYTRRHTQGSGSSTFSGSSNDSNSSRLGRGSDISVSSSKENKLKEDNGWFNTLAGAMKRQFASYVKLQLNSSASSTTSTTSKLAPATTNSNGVNTSPHARRSEFLYMPRNKVILDPYDDFNGVGSADLPPRNFMESYGRQNFSNSRLTSSAGKSAINFEERHRSPDPPPRYNRGQSPLHIRQSLAREFDVLPIGLNSSNRLPRRGTESVPGSPQHFRTRIHYTPEPQRRAYRTYDQ